MNANCNWCGVVFELSVHQAGRARRGQKTFCCSKVCSGRLGKLASIGWTDAAVIEQIELMRKGR